MHEFQIFSTTDNTDWFVTLAPAGFVRSEDDEGRVYEPAGSVWADSLDSAYEVAKAE